MNFDQRIALITGAGSKRGIGREIARQLASRGAAVVLADIDVSGVQEAAKEIEDSGGIAVSIPLDVTDRKQISQAVSDIVNRFGKLDILVNNAGITRPTRVLDISEEEWDLIFKINMKGVFHLTQEVLPYMKQNSYGRIINLGSVSGKRGGGLFGGSHYSAAKAAVSGFSKAVAREMAAFGITCNSVAPGLIGTEITGGLLTPQLKEELVRGIPVGRIGTIGDVAYTIVFLASEEAGYITGEEIDINGGMHID
ncbi:MULTISPECIES: SDR family NAD(P)-dependent oxidoreductase [unclassified Paenibacillus]|uniref:SDR family NAD(P)-dependent oxidoreductase n=1 Tax=unclassified Paenibacillus TaxID=185978 RepID=UPI001AE17697|nr:MULTISPECIES: SDR family NAD(P)-dependent oxidoreductase [unclassified Paenibacillus]MBP1155776.1 NAD(P)-dependent dehydrogenase (short-subunit alcohol dehydrogenase family) [Paenibacillus sp. PvP091]MBP1168838.1 NAD(P)-dependent dehydrogenase (short-subunit alcohol dehydrogenase family) [Paenibacillus sp. PvR098]MBP2439866.1 NAD(P)-dependent dehydrogenase (short-subunit alcohol dehydrogenase family) [Paenibacillus sp. PvP052]